MIRSILTAIAASAIIVLGAGTAAADVVSQSTSEESHQTSSREGTSADAVDHMANGGPGLVEGDGTSGTLQVVGHKPVFDEDGNQIFKEDGVTPVLIDVYGWVPFSTGPAPATIVRN